MKICIGIISYLPDDIKLREIRKERLHNVISKCNELFSLPIIIVAQNWGDDIEIEHVTVFKYANKLGITEARRKLREIFLDSDYDYLIMLDDDAKLVGTKEDADKYIQQIEDHPGQWGAYKSFLLKLFAISKDIYKQIDFPKGEAEQGDFFEDMYLIMALDKKFKVFKFIFKRTSLNDVSDSSRDPNSTWFRKQFNKHSIGDRTRDMVRRL